MLPFGDDPCKLPFHRALARVPGLLHVTVLRCGHKLAAANVDADNRGQLALGFAAMSPWLARHSPGTLQTLFLSRDVAARGYRSIDLTPGGASYKDLLATSCDEVYTLEVFFSGRAYAVSRVREGARRAARALVKTLGVDASAVRARALRWRQAVESAGPGSTPARALRAARARLWHRRELQIFELDERLLSRQAAAPMRADRLGDLALYRPGVLGWQPRYAFLRDALSRLERGAHVYTRAEEGELVATAWLTPAGAIADAQLASALPPDAVLVHDLAASPPLCRADEWTVVLALLAHEAAAVQGVARVLVAVPRDRPDLVAGCARLGGTRLGSVHDVRRLGRRRSWSTLPVVPRSEAVAETPAEARV